MKLIDFKMECFIWFGALFRI